MRKLIAIMTCDAKRAWADAQRQTWVKDIVARGYADVKFFLGTMPRIGARCKEDEIYLDCPDDYRGIPLKVKAICEWSREHCYDFTAKVDDDVYMIPDRLPYLPLMLGDYIGRFRSPYGKVYPPHFASGFAYWLSARAAAHVADTPWNGDWMDERFVATVLARHGIFGYNDSASYCVAGPHLKAIDVLQHPKLSRGTAFCEYGPSDMLEMHKVLGGLQHVSPSVPCPVQVPAVMVTDEILQASPGDDVPGHKIGRNYVR